jgi:predicted O-methyltransferase YrrM
MNSLNELLDSANAFRQTKILFTAIELNIFDLLSGNKLSSEQVTTEIKGDFRATNRFLNALASIGLLKKSSSLFSNSDLAQRYLVTTSKDYLANFPHLVTLWNRWNYLTEAVIQGKTVSNPIKQMNEKTKCDFIAAMHSGSSSGTAKYLKLIDLKGVKRIVDLGGGSGAFAFAFAKQSAEISVTIIEEPSIVPITRKYIASSGFNAQVEVIAGDFMVNDLGEDYDLAFLSSIIHIYSPEQNISIFKKVFNALKVGGKIVIKDFIMNQDRTSPVSGAIFALNMLVATEKGDTYTELEISDWLLSSGFRNVTRKVTDMGQDLIIAIK